MEENSDPIKYSTQTLERLNPRNISEPGPTGAETLKLHLDRYGQVANWHKGKTILDIACGVGYGTAYLAERLGPEVAVVGVDIEEEGIAYAKLHYQLPNIQYVVADALAFSWPTKFDHIVSLETIEHVQDAQKLLTHFGELLAEDGLLSLSVPITPSVDVNPYHRTDFTKRSLQNMMKANGYKQKEFFLQRQSYNPISILMKKEPRTRDLRDNLWKYYVRHPKGALSRLWATMRYGFNNYYYTSAWHQSTRV